MKKAIIDRIVDSKHAVLFLEPGEQEFIVPLNKVPANAKEGDWVTITVAGEITIDTAHTKETKNRIHSKLEKLRNIKNKSLFKKE